MKKSFAFVVPVFLSLSLFSMTGCNLADKANDDVEVSMNLVDYSPRIAVNPSTVQVVEPAIYKAIQHSEKNGFLIGQKKVTMDYKIHYFAYHTIVADLTGTVEGTKNNLATMRKELVAKIVQKAASVGAQRVLITSETDTTVNKVHFFGRDKKSVIKIDAEAFDTKALSKF